MKRRIAAIAVSMIAVGVAVMAPTAANAASRPLIRTYAGRTSVYFKGVGSQQGWFTSQSYTESVVLAPHVSLSEKSVFDYGRNDHHRSTQLYYVVGNHSYTKNGNGHWSVLGLSNSALRSEAQALNPYLTRKAFLTLPQVRRPSSSHYLVTGDYAHVGRFLQSAFGLPKAVFGGTSLKVFTISFWDDFRGRPVRITVSAKSSTFMFTVAETFSNYNKPLTIAAP